MTGTFSRQTSTESERKTREEMRKKMQVATVDMGAKGAKDDFNRSLQETGFAVLVNHGVDRKLIEGVYDEWRGFMMSLDEKVKAEGGHNCISEYLRSTDVFDGYFPMDLAETAKSADVKDIKHYYHCYFPHGRYPKEVSDDGRTMFDLLYNLGLKLCEWIDDGLSPETKQRLKDQGMESLAETVSREDTLLRILHYPAYDDGKAPPGAVRAAAHEDINHITLLPVGSSRGLQLFGKEEQQWFDVPFEPESIIVNIGDMLQALTDGALVSTTHRVVKSADEPAGQDRMSSPVFVHAKPTVFLNDEVGTAREYLIQRLTELAKNSASSKPTASPLASPSKNSETSK
jgi:isopenicillin N synthase-like dioxygenase